MAEDYEVDAWAETMAAAGWPEDESIEDKVAADLAVEREQAFWASPAGEAEQVRQHRATKAASGDSPPLSGAE